MLGGAVKYWAYIANPPYTQNQKKQFWAQSNFWTVRVSRSKSNFLPLGAILLAVAQTLTPQKEKDHPEERETERERRGGAPKKVFTSTGLYPPQYFPVKINTLFLSSFVARRMALMLSIWTPSHTFDHKSAEYIPAEYIPQAPCAPTTHVPTSTMTVSKKALSHCQGGAQIWLSGLLR